uniref:Uncharacterized protein n=1 Tax=Canis lupus dingo TaxID=286419 RepID=A0A8C0LJ48_CANLU
MVEKTPVLPAQPVLGYDHKLGSSRGHKRILTGHRRMLTGQWPRLPIRDSLCSRLVFRRQTPPGFSGCWKGWGAGPGGP